MPFDDLERVMAANVFHRAVVLGPVTDGLASVDGLNARFLRDGERAARDRRRGRGDGAAAPSIALVSGYLEAVGESLQAGDVIIAGSLVTALPAAPGERFELQVDVLGSVALELA